MIFSLLISNELAISVIFSSIFEVLNLDDEIKEAIMQGKSSLEIRKEALQHGYRPLVVDGINKIIKGHTTLEELNKKLLIY